MTAPRRATSSRRSRAEGPAEATSIPASDGDGQGRPPARAAGGRAAKRVDGAAATRRGAEDRAAPEAPRPVEPALAPGEDRAQFDGQYRIKLESFEGPLDLLLHLIQQHELDILDIPVSFITEKYLEYLKLMQVLSIEIASEYLVMAATLVHIKSKMLLPAPPPGQDDGMPQEEEEDPRAELVRRLLEYQKYKAAAAELADRGTLGRDIFPRGIEEAEEPGPAAFAKVEVFGLLEAFERILKKTKVKVDHEVVFDRISITDRIVELTEKLQGRRAVRFEWLFLGGREGPTTRFDLVITFLAMLEMCRMKLLRVYQTGPLQPIYMGLIEEVEELTEDEQARADREAVKVLADEPEPTPASEAAAEGEQESASEPEELVIEDPPVLVEVPSEVVEEASAVVEEASAVVEEASAVVEEASAVLEEASAVMEEASAVVEETVVEVQTGPSVVEASSAAVQTGPSMAEEPSAAVQTGPSVVEEPSAAVEEVPSVLEEPSAAVEEVPSVLEEPSAVVEEVPSVLEEPSAVVEEVPSVLEEPSAAVEEASAITGEASAEEEEDDVPPDEVNDDG